MGKLVLISLILFSCSFIIKKSPSNNIYKTDRDYHANGNLKYESNYMYGKLHGELKNWDKNENLLSVVQYRHGVLHGKWISYYPSGILKHTVSYINGKKSGKEIWFHPNGEPQSEAYYKDGNIDSEIKRWDEDGQEIIN